MSIRSLPGLFKSALREFSEDKAPRLAAALAYYSLFSIAPLLVISIAIAGFVFGEEAARGEIVAQIEGVVGAQGGEAIQTMVQNAAEQKGQGIFAAIAGLVALLFGASGVFSQLKDTLNTIWGVEAPKSGGIWGFVRQRLLSFAMVLTVGFLLLTSLVLSALLAGLGHLFPGGEAVGHVMNAGVSLAVITVLFALIYKYVPDATIRWKDVWIGAAFTSLLFVVGKFAIGLYLGKSSTASTYGAAASLIIVILWLYYSGLILFFGAEFTEVYARRHAGLKSRAERREAGLAPSQPAKVRLERSRATRWTEESGPGLAARSREGPQRKSGMAATIAAGIGGAVVGALVAIAGMVIAAAKLTGRIFK
jgi:membrane protein